MIALQTLFTEGGPIMPLILLAALAGYVLAIERLLVWGRWHLRERPLARARGARELLQLLGRLGPEGPASPLVALLRCGVEYRALPPARREQAMHLEILARLPGVEARISTIGWLGGILPMLGLLGTVSGMIATFRELSFAASRQALSQGLSEALWTTEVGLLGALPLLAVHHLLSRLRGRWLNRLELGLALLFEDAPEKGEHPAPEASRPPHSPRPPTARADET